MAIEIATLGGGCFWCIEHSFARLKGVKSAYSGYAGGNTLNPTYEDICTGISGHAEVVQVTFDSTEITFEQLLIAFFTLHDPTTLNRQGNDIGTQYRSVIFTHDEQQNNTAKKVISAIDNSKLWSSPVVTELCPLDVFYLGENYHQDYFNQNPQNPYCQMAIAPKVAKFLAQFKDAIQ